RWVVAGCPRVGDPVQRTARVPGAASPAADDDDLDHGRTHHDNRAGPGATHIRPATDDSAVDDYRAPATADDAEHRDGRLHLQGQRRRAPDPWRSADGVPVGSLRALQFG